MRSSRNAVLRRLIPAVLVGLAVGSGGAHAAGPPIPPYTQAEYWALGDRMMAGLDPLWSESRRAYAEPGRTASVRANSAMLVTHAIAALEGHAGPTRRDARARVLADRLSSAPVWLGSASVRSGHGPLSTCWGLSMEGKRPQHPSLEPKVADALAWAWRARRALDLPSNVVRRIQRRVSACASSRAWRFSPRVTNQINWNAELYASAVTVTGDSRWLVRDYRRQLAAFAAGITRPMPGKVTPNLGRNYQFHYQPAQPATAGINLDSPEYGNIVAHALIHHERARRLGMPPLPAEAMRHLRAWTTRLLAGNWTHAGYLNWDTGKGFTRWHSAQYWAFAQQGLLAIATSPSFRTPEEGRWAKALFDRGLHLYRRLGDESGSPLAPDRMFGVKSQMRSYDTYSARMLANITRATALDLGNRRATDPPPLYAFDYDTGRLAVTTPRYSTAVVPDNRGAFPCGGIELARLFTGDQRVAANLGGTPPGTFGIVVADRGGRSVLSSQHGRAVPGSLRLIDSPRGEVVQPRPYPARPHAGPFRILEARGLVRRGPLAIRTAHRFERDAIVTRWRVSCAGPCDPYRIRAHFPTWGGNAVIAAISADGTVRRIARGGTARMPVRQASQLRLASQGRGATASSPPSRHRTPGSSPCPRDRIPPTRSPVRRSPSSCPPAG